jgi:hypothetical protein
VIPLSSIKESWGSEHLHQIHKLHCSNLISTAQHSIADNRRTRKQKKVVWDRREVRGGRVVLADEGKKRDSQEKDREEEQREEGGRQERERGERGGGRERRGAVGRGRG